jgi:hypothetical protein
MRRDVGQARPFGKGFHLRAFGDFAKSVSLPPKKGGPKWQMDYFNMGRLGS